MTNKFYSFMFWTFPPRLWLAHLGVLVQWTVVLPENHAFIPKMQFWLGPIAKCVYFRWKSSVLYEFDDKCIVFLHVLDLSPQIWSQNLGALVQWTVMLPENFYAFLPKMTILLILNTDTHFVKKFSYSISLMTKIIHFFIMYWTLLHSIKIRIPWDIILIRQALPENHAFCLGPIAKYIHFR